MVFSLFELFAPIYGVAVNFYAVVLILGALWTINLRLIKA